METKEFKYESEKLENTLVLLEETLEGEKLRIKVLPKKYGHDPRLLQSLMSMTHQKITGIENHLDKPYFARIDFHNNSIEKKEQLYIGKVGVIDLDGNILVTDWRAPISSLYYDSNLGKTQYQAPEGIIEGNLELKRQIIIENKKLKEIFDVDSVSDDELLKPYLGANADNRLKNIVASIQKEQNDIIRLPLYKNLIVQGVAGSGKTTVALHRIAYLMYNNSSKYQANQFMVIGPNKFFINYISNVLPDLDAAQAVQYTYEELAKEYINEKFEVKNSTEKLVRILSNQEESKLNKHKLSMKYKEELEKFIDKFQNEFVPSDGITLNGFCIYTKKEICELLSSFDVDFSTKLQRVQKNIETTINNSHEALVEKCKKYFDELIEKTSSQEKIKELTEKKWETVDEINNKLKNYLKKIFNIKNLKVLTLYQKFIEEYENYSNNFEISKQLIEQTKRSISKKQYDFEDLPALMYLKLRIFGSGKLKEIAHVIVDEAQDFGTFNFYVIKNIMSSSTFSIFGDLTQGIYDYRAISAWEEVIDSTFDNNCTLMKLEKSYRTTVEIMDIANHVSKSIGLFEGKPVIRHGNEVKINKVCDNKNEYILNKINNYKLNGYNSIAIVCKTPEESKNVFDELIKQNLNISLIAEDNEVYNGGICVVPAHLSKGLEFDCVLIYDADEKSYANDNKLDMKLLYVAMTRALHNLDIIYTDNVTEPLINYMAKKEY